MKPTSYMYVRWSSKKQRVTWLEELVKQTSWTWSSREFRTRTLVASTTLRSMRTVPEKVEAERSVFRWRSYLFGIAKFGNLVWPLNCCIMFCCLIWSICFFSWILISLSLVWWSVISWYTSGSSDERYFWSLERKVVPQTKTVISWWFIKIE